MSFEALVDDAGGMTVELAASDELPVPTAVPTGEGWGVGIIGWPARLPGRGQACCMKRGFKFDDV